MKTKNFTTLRKGSKTNQGKIGVCPACDKKGAVTVTPRFDIYLHSHDYTDSSIFRHIHKSQTCKVDAPKDRLELYEKMVLLVGGERPNSMVNHNFFTIWNGAKDNPTRLRNFLRTLIDRLENQISKHQNKIGETERVYHSIDTNQNGKGKQ